MTKIFVSYRRDDSADNADLIVTHLTDVSRTFAHDDVFFDVESIPLGVNVLEYINERVSQCVVMLVIIGPDWATIIGDSGAPRLHSPNDIVRIEIETALSRSIPLIPVLVRGASFPKAADLPESLRDLVDYNGLEVRRAPDFKTDMARLIAALQQLVKPDSSEKNQTTASAAETPKTTPGESRSEAPKKSPLNVDPTKFTLLRTLQGHESMVIDCAISPDGRKIVSASRDKTLKLWDSTNGNLLHTLQGHTDIVTSCAFSPDGLWIVSSSWDKTLKMWDTRDGRLIRSLTSENLQVFIQDCAVSPDGTWIVSAHHLGLLKLWDTNTGKEFRTIKGHTDGKHSALCCAISPDGRWIVSGSDDKTLKMWDTASGGEIRTLKGHTDEVVDCAISSNGRWIASASKDRMVKLWDAERGKELYTLRGHMSDVDGCAFNPDSRWLVSVSGDNSIKFWDPALGRERHSINKWAGTMQACAVSPDGSRVVSAVSKELQIWGMPE